MPDVAAAASERALLAAIIGSTGDAVVSFDRNLSITTWNRAAEELYGWPAEEAMGASFGMLLTDADDGLVDRVFADEQIVHSEVLRRRKDGSTVMVGETASPVRNDSGEVIGAATIAHDITGRLQIHAELTETRKVLEEANRQLARSNVELEQFAYVASHDLSEPLRAVAGMVGLLQRRYQGRLDSDADEFIGFAVDGCTRMRAMIDDILTYARVGRDELAVRKVSLSDAVAAAWTSLASSVAQAGAELVANELPTVRADRNQLHMLLQNLLGNAVKFRRPDVAPVVSVSATLVDAGWRIEIADNGIGIEPQYHARIFRMFQRLHTTEAYPGTGIGLAIADRIVARHGGRIGIESGITGTTIWFELPGRG